LEDKDLIYEGIATVCKVAYSAYDPQVGRQRPDLRRDCDVILIPFLWPVRCLRRQRPDLRRDCDENDHTDLHPAGKMIDDKDLIYEGIATDQPIGDIWMIGR